MYKNSGVVPEGLECYVETMHMYVNSLIVYVNAMVDNAKDRDGKKRIVWIVPTPFFTS